VLSSSPYIDFPTTTKQKKKRILAAI